LDYGGFLPFCFINIVRVARIRNIIHWLKPPVSWKFPVVVASGLLMGVAGYAFYVSNAVSYLSDAPQTCVNCHVMAPHYTTWFHSSHREHATCNDCHVPHDNFLEHYYFKARDGVRHAWIFTMRDEPFVIRIHEPGQRAVQANCKRCHEHTNHRVHVYQGTVESARAGENRLCWDCHREVPHGVVTSPASVPYTHVPLPQSPVPDWLRNMLE
jgi:cytochrome c nitrite reductase small subunit